MCVCHSKKTVCATCLGNLKYCFFFLAPVVTFFSLFSLSPPFFSSTWSRLYKRSDNHCPTCAANFPASSFFIRWIFVIYLTPNKTLKVFTFLLLHYHHHQQPLTRNKIIILFTTSNTYVLGMIAGNVFHGVQTFRDIEESTQEKDHTIVNGKVVVNNLFNVLLWLYISVLIQESAHTFVNMNLAANLSVTYVYT